MSEPTPAEKLLWLLAAHDGSDPAGRWDRVLARIAARLSPAIARVLNVAAVVVPATVADVAEPGLRIELTHATLVTPASVVLGGKTLRAIADRVTGVAADLRGSGPLTPVERGCVEYALLRLLDELLPATLATPLAVRWQFLEPQDPLPSFSHALDMNIGGASNRVGVSLPEAADVAAAIGRLFVEPVQHDQLIMLALAVEGLAVSVDEASRAATGDCLMLPGRRLADLSLVLACRATGVVLASVVALEDELAGSVRTRPNALDARAPAPGISLRIGVATLSVADAIAALEQGSAGRALTIALTGEPPVLCSDGRPVWRGELVLVDGQLAFRAVQAAKAVDG